MRPFPALSLATLALAALPSVAIAGGPWLDLGGALPGSSGAPLLEGAGEPVNGQVVSTTLSNAPPNAASMFIIGATRIDFPVLGGTLIPAADIILTPIVTSPLGGFTISAPWPSNVTPGSNFYFQSWIQDAGAPQGWAVSNGLEVTAGPQSGTFPGAWINGTACGTDPQIQIHAYNPDLYILRQSLCTNFEGPFIVMIFGEDRVFINDTGAGGVAIQSTVESVVTAWLAANNKTSIQRIVAHTHAHGDHVAGDSQFIGKPSTTVVGTSQTSVKNFFGIATWPTDIVEYDLGGRVLDVIPIPGHHSSHIAVYDRRTAILFTGDTLYPGRLYFGSSAGNFATYKASIQRMVDFVSTRSVTWVLGTHIEMTNTPMVDFPFGSTQHPNEHVLQLTRAHLMELHTALQAMPTPVQQHHNDFIIWPL